MRKKTVVITGASGGIGSALAEKFAREGYDTILTCKNSMHRLLELKKELMTNYHTCCDIYQADVSKYKEVSEMFGNIYEQHSSVDILINNAGISYIGLLSDMTIEQWEEIIQTNITSVFNCCKNVIPSMVRNKKGKIINISSVWGDVGASCEVAYSASKGAVNSFTKALAKELAPSNIQVNAMSLGAINTKMNQFLSVEDRKDLIGEIPTNRFGEVGEVAEEVFSLSQGSGYLTGQVIRLDGGWI